MTATQIQAELNSLRECFAKLKIERDNLLYEMDATQGREREWKQTVEKLNDELQSMDKHLSHREREQQEQIRTLESKSAALLADLKYMKQENERLREKTRKLD